MTPVLDRRILGITRRMALKICATAVAAMAAPTVLRAQAASVKVGVLQPLTGALASDGQAGRLGAELAINAINEAGGIKSLGGANIEPNFGDARSTPEGGSSEVERMASENVSAVVGGFASPLCLAPTPSAAR
jgi:branched-chain amino acid transport system substrate-binding protein